MSGEISLWYCRLPAGAVPAELLQELPDDQALRIAQMTRTPVRQQRLLAWHLRNRLLAEELGIGVTELRFVEGAHGKPLLAGVQTELHFNLSHSDGCVAVACGPHPLGLDVEARLRAADWERIGTRLFSDSEQALLQSLPPAQRSAQAAALWSAREAWGKAGGRGIAGFAEDPPFRLVNGAWQPPAGQFCQFSLPQHVLSLALPQAAAVPPLRIWELSLIQEPDGWRLRRKSAKLKAMGIRA